MKRLIPLTCLVALLSACGTSPDPNYYTLSALDGEKLHSKKLLLKIQRPAVDVSIDRPQMVSQDNQFQVVYNNTSLWSEPLDRMVERVLAQDLEKRIPGSVAVTESGAMQTEPNYLIDLDIRQFGINADGRAVLQAVILVHTPKENGTPHPVTLIGAKASPGSTEAQALSELLARLADQMAGKL